MTKSHSGGGRDDERFRSLYEKYFRRVVRFFVQVFGVTEQDAKDLAQDTFVRFLDHMTEYRGDAEWAYLEAIARNVGYNRVRALNTVKRGAVKPVDLDDPAVRYREDTKAPDHVTRIDDQNRIKQLQAEITQLPDGARECLQLYLSDLTYQAIADALQVSLDSVKSRLRDARRQLRQRLGEDGNLPEDES